MSDKIEPKIRLLYIHHGAVPGGAPTSLKNMVKGIARDPAMSCSIYCVRSGMIPFFSDINNVSVDKYPETGLFTGRVFIGWSRSYSLGNCMRLAMELCKAPWCIFREVRFIKQKRPDIVHLNSSILWMSGIAARLCRIPVVWHIREASDDTRYNLVRILYSWFIRKIAANVICIGPQEYEKIGGKGSRKVQVVYNSLADSYFADDQYQKEKLRRQLGLPIDAFLFLSLGGTSFRKGTYQFIDALNHLPESYAAVLVGAKPIKNSVRSERIARAKQSLENVLVSGGYKRNYSWDYDYRVSHLVNRIEPERLFLTGVVEDVQPYIKACDVLIFAGTTPHSARPVYEAWALQKSVIVFDTEVMRRDVDDGVDGLLVSEHTGDSLAIAIKKLCENPDLNKKMGSAGYNKARKRFSMQNNNDKIAALYKEIASANCI